MNMLKLASHIFILGLLAVAGSFLRDEQIYRTRLIINRVRDL